MTPRGRRRALLAAGLLAAWGAGLGALARREFVRGPVEAFADLALRIQPETFYYLVEQGGTPVGYALSSIDTTRRAFLVRDELAADVSVGGAAHRVVASSRVRLSRAFALSDFDVTLAADSVPVRITGSADGDSAVRFTVQGSVPGMPTTPQRLPVRGPILLPSLVPLAVTLGGEPKVGRRATVPTFDPQTMQATTVTLEIKAESLFTVSDSARFDSTAGRWVVARTDTVRAWRLGPVDGPADRFGGWVDERGRLVEGRQPGGLVVRRAAYEVAFENWRLGRPAGGAPAGRDVLESTAIAAGARWTRPLASLRVRLRNVALEDFDLDGDRQSLRGDTLAVTRESAAQLLGGYERRPDGGALRVRFARQLQAEPLLQVESELIQMAARRITGVTRDPRVAAERLVRWVHDSLAKAYVVGIPDAAQVLRSRRGDCNEHTQLYVALARAAGIPARQAAGLAYVDGRFFYHAWPEVWLGGWVAVDPTFGQFPADAAHLRFTVGGLARQAQLVQLIGRLGVDVVEAVPLPAR